MCRPLKPPFPTATEEGPRWRGLYCQCSPQTGERSFMLLVMLGVGEGGAPCHQHYLGWGWIYAASTAHTVGRDPTEAVSTPCGLLHGIQLGTSCQHHAQPLAMLRLDRSDVDYCCVEQVLFRKWHMLQLLPLYSQSLTSYNFCSGGPSGLTRYNVFC